MLDNDKPVLSEREIEVLKVAATGLSNQEIATELFISVNTVRVHLRNVFKKLNVQSRTEATMYAIQEGWITLPTLDAAGNETDEADEGTLEVQFLPLPNLALWQYIYLGIAGLIALMVLSVPLVKPVLSASRTNSITDKEQINNAAPVPALKSERWRYQAEMPIARSRMAVVSFDDRLYLIGGSRSSGPTSLVEVFNPETKEWTEAASKPTQTANIQGAVIAGEIYVPGGCSADSEPTDRLEIYNPADNAWRVAQPLPEPLCAYSATVYNDQLYLIGGWNGSEYLNTVYIYNPQSDSWQPGPEYPIAVGFSAAATVGDKIYVAGGYNGETEFAELNIFDTTSQSWQAGPPLLTPRGGLGLVAVGNNLYAIGGGWLEPLSSNERLSLKENVWSEIDTPYFEQWRNLGLALIGSDIFAVGGWNGEHLNTVVSFPTVYRVFVPFSPKTNK